MNKISIENLEDVSSSKEKMERKKLFFHFKNNSNSIVSNSNSLDLYETNNNSKYLSNNPSIESKENYDNNVENKDILDIKDTNAGNNCINFLRKKTKITFFITREPQKKTKTKLFTTTEYFKNTITNLFLEKTIIMI